MENKPFGQRQQQRQLQHQQQIGMRIPGSSRGSVALGKVSAQQTWQELAIAQARKQMGDL